MLDSTFERQMNYFDSVRSNEGLNTVWSIYEVEDAYAKSPIKVKGKELVYESIRYDATSEDLLKDIAEGTNRSSIMYKAEIQGDTWIDMWKAAEWVISMSGTHHRYIEDFTMNSDGTIELTTGS